MVTLDSVKEIAFTSNMIPTQYYRNNKNHIPPWILFKNISFSTAIDLYSFLPSKLKTELVEDWIDDSDCSLENKKELLKNSIHIVRQFRNAIAHNNNFASFKTSKSKLNLNILPNRIKSTMLDENDLNNLGINDIYSMILSILLLSKNEDLYFLHDMLSLLPKNSTISKGGESQESIYRDYLKLANLPEDFELRLDDCFNSLFNSN